MRSISQAEKSFRFRKARRAIEVPYHDYSKNTTMGNWFSDATGFFLNPVQAAQDTLNAVNQAIKGISNAISSINWNGVVNNLGLVVRIYSNILVQTNLYYLQVEGLRTNPNTAHAFTELNNFTGGFITDFINVDTLPARVTRGDAISKQELIRDAIFALKVAIVALSGGTATSVVSATSGQLSQGTAGRTAVGRDVLVVGSATGFAALTDGAISTAALNAGENVGLSAAQVEVVKKTPLAQTPVGGIAVGAAFAAGGGELTGSGAGAGLSSYGQSTAVSQGSKLATGPLSQVTGAAAGALYTQAGQTSISSSSGGDSQPSQPTDIVGAIGDAIARAGQNIVSVPSLLAALPGKLADAISNISISAPSGASISSPSLSSPSLNMPSGITLPMINIGGILKRIKSRKKSGFFTYTDTLDDGTTVEDPDYDAIVSVGILVLAGLVAGYEYTKYKSEAS